MTHDISLDEFEDDDLSEITEITDERGMSLNCNGPDLKVSERLPPARHHRTFTSRALSSCPFPSADFAVAEIFGSDLFR